MPHLNPRWIVSVTDQKLVLGYVVRAGSAVLFGDPGKRSEGFGATAGGFEFLVEPGRLAIRLKRDIPTGQGEWFGEHELLEQGIDGEDAFGCLGTTQQLHCQALRLVGGAHSHDGAHLRVHPRLRRVDHVSATQVNETLQRRLRQWRGALADGGDAVELCQVEGVVDKSVHSGAVDRVWPVCIRADPRQPECGSASPVIGLPRDSRTAGKPRTARRSQVIRRRRAPVLVLPLIGVTTCIRIDGPFALLAAIVASSLVELLWIGQDHRGHSVQQGRLAAPRRSDDCGARSRHGHGLQA